MRQQRIILKTEKLLWFSTNLAYQTQNARCHVLGLVNQTRFSTYSYRVIVTGAVTLNVKVAEADSDLSGGHTNRPLTAQTVSVAVWITRRCECSLKSFQHLSATYSTGKYYIIILYKQQKYIAQVSKPIPAISFFFWKKTFN